MRTFLLTAMLLAATPVVGQQIQDLKPNRVVVQDIQVQLANHGFKVGTPDGALGGKTVAAFDAFVKEAGLADASLEEQLRALGVDLTAIKNLTFELDGPYLVIGNGLDNGFDEMRYQYDWKSFEVGRYSVTDDGEEHFVLDDKYCDTYAPPPAQSDCDTKRARVQVRDSSDPSSTHSLYSFDVRIDSMPDNLPTLQIAEFTQQGGIKSKHPETGKPVNFSPRFTLEIQEGAFVITDNSMLDVSLTGGQAIRDINVPLRLGAWTHIDWEVIWSTGDEGLFRYWVDGQALWERKGRNTTCVEGESKGECLHTMKYGPYSSHYDGPSYIDTPIKVAIRGMKKSTGDAIAAVLSGLPTDFKASTKREGGPTKPTELVVTEQNSGSQPGKINSHMHVAIGHAPQGKDEVDFNVQGDFGKSDFFSLRIVLNPPLGKERPAGLQACAGEKTTTYDDGRHRAVLTFSKQDKDWVPLDIECYKQNTSDEDRFMIDFLLTRFQEMAVDMIMSGNIGTVRSEQYRGWLQKIAAGEIGIHG